MFVDGEFDDDDVAAAFVGARKPERAYLAAAAALSAMEASGACACACACAAKRVRLAADAAALSAMATEDASAPTTCALGTSSWPVGVSDEKSHQSWKYVLASAAIAASSTTTPSSRTCASAFQSRFALPMYARARSKIISFWWTMPPLYHKFMARMCTWTFVRGCPASTAACWISIGSLCGFFGPFCVLSTSVRMRIFTPRRAAASSAKNRSRPALTPSASYSASVKPASSGHHRVMLMPLLLAG